MALHPDRPGENDHRPRDGDLDCAELLRRVLPRLHLRWKGFRNVRRQVCRRVRQRARALGLDLAAYRKRLENDAAELAAFDALCRVTISRFYRDRGVFERLRSELLPRLAEEARKAGRSSVRALSAGCASGEEPYTLAILWNLDVGARYPELSFEVVATDSDEEVLARALEACYGASSVKELPFELRDAAFAREGSVFRLREEVRRGVHFRHADIRREIPDGPFDLVLCRNLAFTYFDEAAQVEMARRLAERMRPGALLVLGAHEALPRGLTELEPADPRARAFRRVA